MSKRAVLIGINYENSPIHAPLRGCVNDVMNIKRVLVDKYGFPEQHIRVLIDSKNDGSLPLPTAQNIVEAMTAAIQESADGDVLVFHYSGHGSQQQDKSGEEPDGKTELLVSYDAVPITDTSLKSLLTHAPTGLNFTFIADCCHSGSLLNQPQQDVEITGEKSTGEADAYADLVLPEDAVRGVTSRSLSAAQLHNFIANTHGDAETFFANNPFVPTELAQQLAEGAGPLEWVSSAISYVNEQQRTNAAATTMQQGHGLKSSNNKTMPNAELPMVHCVLLSGCMDDQECADDMIANAWCGAFTASLVDSVERAEGTPSYREIMRLARAYLATRGYPQDPTLSCPRNVTDLSFICEPVTGPGGEVHLRQ